MVNYKLHYFNGRGRAEISRLILAAAGVNYDDHRIEDWPSEKPDSPIGQVPYLEIDNTKLPQSLSIARYLAREYNLVGKNNLEAAKADAIVDTCIDLMTAFYYKVHVITHLPAKDAALKAFMIEEAPQGLANIEKLAKTYGSSGHAVGSSLTWADLFIHEIAYSLSNYDADVIKGFSGLKKIIHTVEKNENIAKYLKTRPLTPY